MHDLAFFTRRNAGASPRTVNANSEVEKGNLVGKNFDKMSPEHIIKGGSKKQIPHVFKASMPQDIVPLCPLDVNQSDAGVTRTLPIFQEKELSSVVVVVCWLVVHCVFVGCLACYLRLPPPVYATWREPPRPGGSARRRTKPAGGSGKSVNASERYAHAGNLEAL